MLVEGEASRAGDVREASWRKGQLLVLKGP